MIETYGSLTSYAGVAGCGTDIDSPLLAACTFGAPPRPIRDNVFAVGASVRGLDVYYANGERRRYGVDGGFAGVSTLNPKAGSATALDHSGEPLGNIPLPAPGGYFARP